MARWSLYLHTDAASVESLAVLEQLTSGSDWYTETGEPFTVPVPSTNVIVAEDIEKPAWGRDDPAPEPPPVPFEITMAQARLALHGVGLLGSVDAAIAAMSEPAKTVAAITWEFSSTVQRDNTVVGALASALGLTDAQVDDLFRAGATL